MPKISQKTSHFQTNSVTQFELEIAKNDGIFLRSKKRPSRRPFGLEKSPRRGSEKPPSGAPSASRARKFLFLTRKISGAYFFVKKRNFLYDIFTFEKEERKRKGNVVTVLFLSGFSRCKNIIREQIKIAQLF